MEASAAAKEEEEQEEKQKPTKDDLITLNKHITDEEKNINEELFKKYFNFQRPSDILMFLNKTNDKETNNELVNMINSGLKDFIKFNKEISEEEKMTEKIDKITKIVKKIYKFNRRIQKGQGIKIITPNQMLSRLPITLAQLKAGNNSEKLKNEISQLLYSLYRSKNMTQQLRNNLIKHMLIKNTIIVHKIFIIITIIKFLFLLFYTLL